MASLEAVHRRRMARAFRSGRLRTVNVEHLQQHGGGSEIPRDMNELIKKLGIPADDVQLEHRDYRFGQAVRCNFEAFMLPAPAETAAWRWWKSLHYKSRDKLVELSSLCASPEPIALGRSINPWAGH